MIYVNYTTYTIILYSLFLTIIDTTSIILITMKFLYYSYNIIKYIKIIFFYNFKLQIFQNYDVIEQFDKHHCLKNY